LIIDDDESVRKYLAAAGRRLDFEAATASGREAIVRKLDSFDPTAILLDLQMPEQDGIQILKLLKDYKSKARVVLMSGLDKRSLETATTLGQIFGLNMAGSLQKPILIGDLRQRLGKTRAENRGIDAGQLEQAIDEGEIVPSYQPKAGRNADDHWQINEVEVLARWHRPGAAVVLPGAFIDVAERAGLLPKLTHSILQQSIRQLRRWDDQGLALSASVNISPSLLTDSDFPEQLEDLMRQHGLNNSRLALELTESAITQNAGLALEILGRLRIKGFDLAIDDFGTGYSSLEQLYRMPFNELKIDRFLVRDIGVRSEAETIVEAIIMLGHKLGIRVCAEGVETRNTLDFLVDSGCDKLQGYYLGRPSSANVVEKRIREFRQTGFALARSDHHGPRAGANQGDRGLRKPLPILCGQTIPGAS